MARQVHPGLFVGGDSDALTFSGSILHCARDPWFPRELMLSPHNLVHSFSEFEMALRMVDAPDTKYFSDWMINPGLEFITERFAAGDPVLVHCNVGVSRSPSVALLWMWEHGFLPEVFGEAVAEFKALYPLYTPGAGIYGYLKNRIQ